MRFYKIFLFLFCLFSFQLFGLIDLRNRSQSMLGENVWKLTAGSNDNSSDELKLQYDFIVTQTDIGFGGELVLTEPGRYILESDMTYTYSYAISISNDRILLDLAYKELNGQGLAEGGIFIAQGISPVVKSKLQDGLIYRPGGATLANMHYITIRNGKIDDVLGMGLYAVAIEKLKLENVQVTNADQGFCIERCEDTTLNSCSTRYITQEGFYFSKCLQIFPNNLLAVECNTGALISETEGMDGNNCFICGIIGDALYAQDSSGLKLRNSHFLTNRSAINFTNVNGFLLDGLDSSTTSSHSYIFDKSCNGVTRNCNASNSLANSFHIMNNSEALQFVNISATK